MFTTLTWDSLPKPSIPHRAMVAAPEVISPLSGRRHAVVMKGWPLFQVALEMTE